jgi:hypothetical protein
MSLDAVPARAPRRRQHRQQRLRFARRLYFPHDPARIIHNADARLLDRHPKHPKSSAIHTLAGRLPPSMCQTQTLTHRPLRCQRDPDPTKCSISIGTACASRQ